MSEPAPMPDPLALQAAIARCAPLERLRFSRRLANLGSDAARESKLAEDVAQALSDLDLRATLSLHTNVPSDLPIAAHAAQLQALIEQHPVVIVSGETGSGKSTQLPKLCLALGRGRKARIAHTQPRRIAARSIARRLGEELRASRRDAVGYQVRFDDQTGPGTLVQVMTDGVLLAQIPADPQLLRYDTIIVDEAHERTLNVDFLLGYLHRLLPRRPDLRVIVTSATLDAERFARHFDDAPIVRVSGRAYPVEVRYRPLQGAAEPGPDLHDALVAAVQECLDHGPGDVLVFLPGERDIRDAAEALEGLKAPQLDILPLFARLSAHEQQRIFAPHDGRRVVLATNVAETSLTVPGIRYVVDSGLARVSRYSARLRVQRLPIEPIAQSAATQRAGRCGRIAPGVCIRLYSEDDLRLRDEWTTPEIQRCNLASVILQMKALGLGDPGAFPFLDPPRPGQIREGLSTLDELGALDEAQDLTELGRQLARLPLDPRLGRMLLAARQERCVEEIAILVSALAVQDPRERPRDGAEDADKAHARFSDPRSDFLSVLRLWRAFRDQEQQLSGRALRRWCREQHLSFLRLREWQDVRRQVRGLVRAQRWEHVVGPAPADAIHRSVLSGLLAHVARRGDRHAYQGPGENAVYIFPGSVLFSQRPAWIVSAERVETTRLFARTVAPVRPQWIEQLAPHLVRRSYFDPHWDEDTGFVHAYERVTLWGLVLIERRRVHYGRIDPRRSREIFLRHALVHGHYRCRAPFFRHNQALMARLQDLEQRARQPGLLASADDRFAFFDARIPAGVTDGPSLDRFRSQAERKDRRLLFMDESDLVADALPGGWREAFPDTLRLHGVARPLSYRYEPGHVEDGISLVVPAAALRSLEPEAIERLVPGRLPELLETLLRTLPKQVRRELLPLPDVARELAALLHARPGPLLVAVCEGLGELRRVRVRPRDMRPASLPAHLRMNVRVVDEQGGLLAQGRDLLELKRKLLADVAEALASESSWSVRGLTTWDFDQVPEHQVVQVGSHRLSGWPTLKDRRSHVDQVVADAPDTAERWLLGGVTRLLSLHLQTDLRKLWRAAPGLPRLLRWHRSRGPDAQLQRECLDAIVVDAAGPIDEAPRTRARFDALLDRARTRIGGAAADLWPSVGGALKGYDRVSRKLMLEAPAEYHAPVQDLVRQLASLFGPDWLVFAGPTWRARYAVYLEAMDRRLEGLGRGELPKDGRLRAQVLPHWARYLSEVAKAPEQLAEGCALRLYRWMIEEYRVSVFAQDLGTALPISEERLEAQWNEVLEERRAR